MEPKQVPAERWLIVGCGYVGAQVARRGCEAGHTVYALTRSQSRFPELKALGVQPCWGHWLEPHSLVNLPAIDRILVAVPHRADDTWLPPGEPIGEQDVGLVERTHAVGLQSLLAAIPAGWKQLVYLSTTGVYGESSEGWVDEQTPVSPTRLGPRIAVTAEHWLTQNLANRLGSGQSFCTVRLAGIYGPGRIPLAERLRRGQPLAVPRDGYLNLVHVSDIARMVSALLGNSLQHSTYLFSDGQPVLRETFYRHLAELCGVPDPEFIEPDRRDPKARRATDKRVSPARILAETGFEFEFPDYRSGLAHALAE
ncbi:MAG: NAD-dependent epimerase/dehydratase family protein [Pirellulaceae bacterium]